MPVKYLLVYVYIIYIRLSHNNIVIFPSKGIYNTHTVHAVSFTHTYGSLSLKLTVTRPRNINPANRLNQPNPIYLWTHM